MKRSYIIIFILLCIAFLFYYPSIFFGKIPFPGDLLISHYKPWQAYSFLGYNPGSYPSKDQFFDTIRQLYPWRTLVTSMLQHGKLPLWNPYNFSGNPLLANYQSGVFYPLSLIFLLLPQPVAWTMMIMTQHLLASIFTFLYGRKIGLSRSGALLSAIAFSYSLFLTGISQYSIIGHTIAWLPLMLWAIESMLQQKPKTSVLLILFGATTCMILAGHIQIAAIVFVTSVGYGLLRTKTRENRNYTSLFLILLTMACAASVTSMQLMPTLELIGLSARTSHDPQFLSTTLLLAPYQLLLFLIPDLFGNPATNNYLISDTYATNTIAIGIVPFVFALIALFEIRRAPIERAFLILISIVLLLTVRTPIAEAFYKLPIPIITSSSPSNMLFVLAFFASILAGFGLDHWKIKQKLSLYAPIGVIVVLLILGYILPSFGITVSKKNLLYSVGLSGVTVGLLFLSKYFKKLKPTIVALLLLLTVLDLFYFFTKFTPFVPKSLVFPQAPVLSWLKAQSGIDRFWGYGTAAIEANYGTQYRLFSPDGYDPLYPKRYGQLLISSIDGKIGNSFTRTNRSDATIAPGYGELDFTSNPYRQKILNLLGVKYILDRKENLSTMKTFPPEIYRLVYDKDDWVVYENTHAIPRLFLTTSYQIFDSPQEFERIFFDKTFSPRSTVLLEQPPKLPCCSGTAGAATMRSYGENEIIIETQNDGAQLLFLSDTYYPGWRAFIDETETEILRAQSAFRAVVVPTGNHTVTFRYQPHSFSLGIKMSMISVVLFLVLLLWNKKHVA